MNCPTMITERRIELKQEDLITTDKISPHKFTLEDENITSQLF